jgi:hypothetical protein
MFERSYLHCFAGFAIRYTLKGRRKVKPGTEKSGCKSLFTPKLNHGH